MPWDRRTRDARSRAPTPAFVYPPSRLNLPVLFVAPLLSSSDLVYVLLRLVVCFRECTSASVCLLGFSRKHGEQ